MSCKNVHSGTSKVREKCGVGSCLSAIGPVMVCERYDVSSYGGEVGPLS